MPLMISSTLPEETEAVVTLNIIGCASHSSHRGRLRPSCSFVAKAS